MKTTLSSGLLLLLLFARGCPSSYTLGFPGPHPIVKYETTFQDNLPVTIYMPDPSTSLRNVPAIVFDPAWNLPRFSYDGYCTQLAQWGFVVANRYYPTASYASQESRFFAIHIQQSKDLVDWLAAENLRPASPLFEMVNAEKVGSIGHSFGAGIAIFHAAADPRVKAMVSLDSGHRDASVNPEQLLSTSEAAMMYILAADAGSCDASVGAVDRVALFDVSPHDAAEVTIAGADHIDFIERFMGVAYLAQVACPQSPGPPDPQGVRDIAARYMVSWFNVYLNGLDEFETYYKGVDAQADIDSGAVTIRLKTTDPSKASN